MAVARKTVELIMKLKEQLSGPLRTMGQRVGQTFRSMENHLALGVGALQAFALVSIRTASQVEESSAKFGAVFKEESGRVEASLTELAGTINRSRFDLMAYAATIQDTFVPLGFARDVSADMALVVTALSEDLASFNNLRTEDVIRDLQSALVGNTETLRKYGVVAQQAEIQQFALTNGLWDGSGAIDAQAKAAAILGITLASTTDAQGDAARTSDSFANQMKGLQAEIKDVQVELGNELIPKILDFVDTHGPGAIDTLKNIGDAAIFMFGTLITAAEGWSKIIRAIKDAVNQQSDATDAADILAESVRNGTMSVEDALDAYHDLGIGAREALGHVEKGTNAAGQATIRMAGALNALDGITDVARAGLDNLTGTLQDQLTILNDNTQGFQDFGRSILDVFNFMEEEGPEDEDSGPLGTINKQLKEILELNGLWKTQLKDIKDLLLEQVEAEQALGEAQEQRLQNLQTLWQGIIETARTAEEEAEKEREELGNRAADSAARFATGFAIAMDQGKEATERFFENFRAQLIQTVALNAFKLLFRLLFGGSTEGFGLGSLFSGLFGFQSGGTVPAHRAQAGMIVPGSGFGDQVPMLLEPGEVVLPRGFSREMIQAAMSGGRGGTTFIDQRRPLLSTASSSEIAQSGRILIEVLKKSGVSL